MHSVINLNTMGKPGLEEEAGSSYSAPSMGVELAKLIYTCVCMLINSICNMSYFYTWLTSILYIPVYMVSTEGRND